MKSVNRREALQLGLAASSVCMLGPIAAQTPALPETARILVGFPPGGGIDLISRRLAELLTGKLAKSVIVDNKPGAAGRIAVDAALQSQPDGLTLLMNPAGVLTINPHTFKKSNYDPFTDFTALSVVAMIDFGFAVGPGVPAEVKSLADFAKWAKANEGRVTFGSPAAGAPPHFVGDLLSRKLGLNMTHVPYRGGAPAMNDLLGGQISGLVLTLGDLIQNAKAGKLRLLASTGPTRSKFAPDTPTFSELNVTGLDVRDWFALYIAGAASDGVKARVLPLVRGALASSAYTRGVESLGIEPISSTPQEAEQLFRTDYVRWGSIVRASGFSADA